MKQYQVACEWQARDGRVIRQLVLQDSMEAVHQCIRMKSVRLQPRLIKGFVFVTDTNGHEESGIIAYADGKLYYDSWNGGQQY